MLSKKEKYKVIWSDGVIMEKKKIRSRKIVKYGMAFLIHMYSDTYDDDGLLSIWKEYYTAWRF